MILTNGKYVEVGRGGIIMYNFLCYNKDMFVMVLFCENLYLYSQVAAVKRKSETVN